jgi:heme/copper-type cytochrome/quinol oxidase subunit 2
MVVLAAQLLLIAMSIAWCVQLTLIAVRGEICLTETNAGILYGEIAATVLVVIFAVVVFVMQYRRLAEKRISDSRQHGE